MTEYRTVPLPECSCDSGHYECAVAGLLGALEAEGWTVDHAAVPSWNNGARRSVVVRREAQP